MPKIIQSHIHYLMKLDKILLLFLTFLTFSFPAFANTDQLDGLLKSYVTKVTSNGVTYNGVDYEAWGKDPRHALVRDELLKTNSKAFISKNEKLAYWINLYNVLTIDLITREGETKSIKNLGTLLNTPWKKHKWNVSGKEYSLDDIEHKIIRPLGEPRIHFAVNCAAKSCPDLRNEAYRANILDAQLADQVHKTFANTTKGYIYDPSQNSVRVSKVMDWFKKDFDNGNIQSWLIKNAPDTLNEQTAITFFDYNWSLNSQ